MPKLNPAKYMMATKATHKTGDISRDIPDLCRVRVERKDSYLGEWVTGFGFVDVVFPKETTRELTVEETDFYKDTYVQIGGQPPMKLDIS